MNIHDILQLCSQFETEREHDISQDFVERVFFAKDIKKWENVLSDILGPAVKKAGDKTTQNYFDLTINYGGILDSQTLFYKKFKEHSIIAMFWPWRDNNQVTLKIARFKE